VPERIHRYNVNVLDPFLARVGTQEDSSRPVRPVSAFNEHIYDGWYENDFHNYRSARAAYHLGARGAGAALAGRSARDVWGFLAARLDKLAYHDFQYEQTFKDAKLPMPSSWPEFVENSQRYQADLLKYAIEHYRRAKYTRIGSFFQFQFIDCWPSITWSVVSYARRPKLGYFAMQQAFQPVLIELTSIAPYGAGAKTRSTSPRWD